MVKEDKTTIRFRELAQTLADQYAHDIAAQSIALGHRPGFDELMEKLKLLEKDITEKGVKLIEIHKRETNEDVDHLVKNFKVIISNTIESFVSKL